MHDTMLIWYPRDILLHGLTARLLCLAGRTCVTPRTLTACAVATMWLLIIPPVPPPNLPTYPATHTGTCMSYVASFPGQRKIGTCSLNVSDVVIL